MSILKKTEITGNPKNSAPRSEGEILIITEDIVLDDYEKQIVELWNKGVSATHIAILLHRTRNVIMGKVWRLRQKGVDFSHHERPKSDKPPRERKPREKKPSVLPLFEFKQPKPRVELKQAVDAKPLNIRFRDLTATSCRYVVNDGPPENFIFCGAPKERGSYCEAHALICYVPSRSASRQQPHPIWHRPSYR